MSTVAILERINWLTLPSGGNRAAHVSSSAPAADGASLRSQPNGEFLSSTVDRSVLWCPHPVCHQIEASPSCTPSDGMHCMHPISLSSAMARVMRSRTCYLPRCVEQHAQGVVQAPKPHAPPCRAASISQQRGLMQCPEEPRSARCSQCPLICSREPSL